MNEPKFRGGIESTFYQGTADKIPIVDFDTAPIEILANAIRDSYTGTPGNNLPLAEQRQTRTPIVVLLNAAGSVALSGETA